MTEGRKSSGFSVDSNVFLTIVRGGLRLRKPGDDDIHVNVRKITVRACLADTLFLFVCLFYSPPTGSLGLPVTNWRKSRCCSASKLLNTSNRNRMARLEQEQRMWTSENYTYASVNCSLNQVECDVVLNNIRLISVLCSCIHIQSTFPKFVSVKTCTAGWTSSWFPIFCMFDIYMFQKI